jgi:hypothetical protein
MTPQKSKTLSEKNQALSILINRDGLSFLTYNPATKEVGRLKSYDFQENVAEEELHEYIKKYLAEQGVTDQSYSDVRLCIANNLSTFVPEPLFDENKRATFLEDHADIRKHDFVSFDNVSSTDAVNVYIPYVNVNNMFLEMFGSFSYVHASSLLLDILSKKAAGIDKNNPYWVVHVQHSLAYFFVFTNGQLAFYNAFSWQNETDLLYFTLAVAKNNKIDLNKVTLWLSGRISPRDETHQLLSNYVNTTHFLMTSKALKTSNVKLLHSHHHNLLLELHACEL